MGEGKEAELKEGKKAEEREGTGHVMMDLLTEVLSGDNSLHNYALLMLWASQSNAVPVSALTLSDQPLQYVLVLLQAVFWTLCHLLSDPECYERACKEARNLSVCAVGEVSMLLAHMVRYVTFIQGLSLDLWKRRSLRK